MSYQPNDPLQAAREFIATHLRKEDLLPHLAMMMEITASKLRPLHELDCTPEQGEDIESAIDSLMVAFCICTELPHHAVLKPHVPQATPDTGTDVIG